MKLRLLPLIVTVCLATSGVAAGAQNHQEFVTGEDWLSGMSVREKYMSLIPPALLFSDYDVHLRLSLPQYIFLIDRVMERNPRLQNEEIANVFASTIYLFEPQNRQALKEMEAQFLKGDFSLPEMRAPRLTIKDVLDEIAEDPPATES